MSWSTGLILACALLVAIYVVAAILDGPSRDWDDDYQWKLRRRIERNAAKQRWGGR